MNTKFFDRNDLRLRGRLTVLIFVFFVLAVGCGRDGDSTPELAVVVPTPRQNQNSPVTLPAEGLPPVVVTAVEDNNSDNNKENEIRPTWTPLPVGTERAACQQPAGWVSYSVQVGNTLSEIAKWSGSTVDELAEVNCIADTRRIEIGQIVFVPNLIVSTNTPNVTATPVPTETPIPTATPNTQTTIDFFYVDTKELFEDPENGEIMLRWQVVGPGEYILSWEHDSYLEPVILQEGGQGEYSLNLEVPELSGTVVFKLTVFDDDENKIDQTVEVELPTQ